MSNPIDLIPEGSITKDELIALFEGGPLTGKEVSLNGTPYKYHEEGYFSPSGLVPATKVLKDPTYVGLLCVRYLDAGAEVEKKGNTVILHSSESVHCTPIEIVYTHEEPETPKRRIWKN